MKTAPRLNSDMVEQVMTQGRAVKTASFLFKYVDKSPNSKAYFGFIASKKSFPTAVERNRAKRRGRSALSKVFKFSYIQKRPVLAAFILNKSVLSSDFDELVLEIEQILVKSGILVKP